MLEGTKERREVFNHLDEVVGPEEAKTMIDDLINAVLSAERVANHLDEMGTSSVHDVMTTAIQELPVDHVVRVIWERLDELLREGGANCLPAPWTL